MEEWAWGVIAIAVTVMMLRQEFIAHRSKLTLNCVEEIKIMHEHPDDYGFGSKKTNELLEKVVESGDSQRDMARSMREIVGYVKSGLEALTNRTLTQPPPDLGGK